jgi:hypothetical protein
VTDISLTAESWSYFVNGIQVDTPDLLKKEGQDYCGINVSSKNESPYASELTKEFQKNGVNRLPKSANPYILTEISWYVPTVFFKGKTDSGETVGFVVSCGTVQDGELNKKEETSLAAIEKNLGAFISKQ